MIFHFLFRPSYINIQGSLNLQFIKVFSMFLPIIITWDRYLINFFKHIFDQYLAMPNISLNFSWPRSTYPNQLQNSEKVFEFSSKYLNHTWNVLTSPRSIIKFVIFHSKICLGYAEDVCSLPDPWYSMAFPSVSLSRKSC